MLLLLIDERLEFVAFLAALLLAIDLYGQSSQISEDGIIQ